MASEKPRRQQPRAEVQQDQVTPGDRDQTQQFRPHKRRINNSLYNADCLFLLERLPPELVTLAYLDPPWPTLEEPIEKYLHFLTERLLHVHRVLSNSGSLFIHLPPEISHYTQVLLDKIFGRENYRNQFILPKPLTPAHDLRHYINYSLIIYYSKSDDFIYSPSKRPLIIEEIEKRYPLQDGRGRYRLDSLITPSRSARRPNLTYEWKGVKPPPGRSWRYTKERLTQLFDEGLVSFSLSKKLPSLKVYFDPLEGVDIGSIWDDIPRNLNQDEKVGFVAQQSVVLLARIIKMSSNEGDLVLDPFCGSGTALVAAQETKRKWIGCDISRQAIETTLQRLTDNFSLTPDVDIEISSCEEIERDYPANFGINLNAMPLQLIPRLVESFDIPILDYSSHNQLAIPLVITEGKTDWKHLKAAFIRLKEVGYYREGFEIGFQEYEYDMGDEELLKICSTYSKISQPRPIICIFDRDNKTIVPKVTAPSGEYKNWGNNVFSFALPVPSHREQSPNINIEFYYNDENIRTTDLNGRRLFFNSEFNQKSGRHLSESLNCMDRNKLHDGPKIIDNEVYDDQNKNVALPKNDFADYVLNAVEGFNHFEVAEFRKVFDVISSILEKVSNHSTFA